MLFDHIGMQPEQEFELIADSNGIHEYPIR